MQQKLDNNGLMILDSTCSFGKLWPKHATIRIDIRPETKPDIVMDAKDLKFPDAHFDSIYCDPPHFIKKDGVPEKFRIHRRLTGRKSPCMVERYWFWKNQDEWFDFIEKTNNEFSRCLKSNGILYYKMTSASGCVRTEDLIKRMTRFKLIKHETLPTKSNYGKGNTEYLQFKPINDIW